MRHYRKSLALMILSVLLFSLMAAGCSASPFSSARKDQIKVIASIYPMADFAKKIGGEHVFVIQLIPSGFEPHTWEPSTLDMKTFEEADVFIYNGAGMEMWADPVLSSIRNKKLLSVNTSAAVDLIEPGAFSVTEDSHEEAKESEGQDEGEHGAYDPHVWLDPMNAKLQMEAICEAFCRADPEHEEDYRNNYTAFSKEADALDKEYHDALRASESPYIVVSHEAFGYLCKAYGLVQIPIRGISADAEPDAARMKQIIETTEKYNVRVVFFEALGSPKVAEAIALETGCETLALHPIGGLTEEQSKAGEDYFSLMRSNLEALVYALS